MTLDEQYEDLIYIPWHEAQEKPKEKETFTIFYAYGFKLDGEQYGFKNKSLQNITGISPKYIPQCENSGSMGWWINRKWVSFSKAKSMTVEINKTVDVTHMAWYVQLDLEMGLNPARHTETRPLIQKNRVRKPNLQEWLKKNREENKKERILYKK